MFKLFTKFLPVDQPCFVRNFLQTRRTVNVHHLTYQIDKEKRQVEKEMFTIPIHLCKACDPYTTFWLNASDNYMLMTHIYLQALYLL